MLSSQNQPLHSMLGERNDALSHGKTDRHVDPGV